MHAGFDGIFRRFRKSEAHFVVASTGPVAFLKRTRISRTDTNTDNAVKFSVRECVNLQDNLKDCNIVRTYGSH